MRLSRLNLILFPSVLAIAAPVWGEARQASPKKAAQPRPLNLSLPRDVLHATGSSQGDETVQRNLRAPAPVPPGGTQGSAQLRFGAGYEQRRLDMGGTASGASAGAGPETGSGRRGR